MLYFIFYSHFIIFIHCTQQILGVNPDFHFAMVFLHRTSQRSLVNQAVCSVNCAVSLSHCCTLCSHSTIFLYCSEMVATAAKANSLSPNYTILYIKLKIPYSCVVCYWIIIDIDRWLFIRKCCTLSLISSVTTDISLVWPLCFSDPVARGLHVHYTDDVTVPVKHVNMNMLLT